MKLITAIIKPFKLDDVKDALKDAGVQGMTVTEVQGFGRQRATPRCTAAPSTRSTSCRRCKLEVLVDDGDVDRVVDVIVERGAAPARSATARCGSPTSDRRACASAPASSTPTPSDSSKAETVRARATRLPRCGPTVVHAVPDTHREGTTMIKGLFFAVVIFLVGTFPATWLLMLFLGNVHANVSYWGALPLGALVSVALGALTANYE